MAEGLGRDGRVFFGRFKTGLKYGAVDCRFGLSRFAVGAGRLEPSFFSRHEPRFFRRQPFHRPFFAFDERFWDDDDGLCFGGIHGQGV